MFHRQQKATKDTFNIQKEDLMHLSTTQTTAVTVNVTSTSTSPSLVASKMSYHFYKLF